MQSAVFDPLNVVVNLHPTPRTWDLTLIGTFVLGAILTYVFCRVVGMGYLAAIVGATAYSLSGYFSLYSNNGFVRTFVYLPAALPPRRVGGALEAVRARSRCSASPCSACIAVGMPEIAVFVAPRRRRATRVYRVGRAVLGSRSRWPASLALAGGFGFGVALATPLLLLFVEYESLSFNIHKGESGVGAADRPAAAAAELAGAVLQRTAEQRRRRRPASMSGTRNWIGGAVFALALVGLASRTRRGAAGRAVLRRRRPRSLLAKAYGLPAARLDRPPARRSSASTCRASGCRASGSPSPLVAAAGVDGIRATSAGSAVVARRASPSRPSAVAWLARAEPLDVRA